MTQIREGGVEIPAVTQADREAAADLYNLWGYYDTVEALQSGASHDGDDLVQAFARHRIAYTPAPSPEIAEQPMGEAIKRAINDAMQDERDGVPCGSIIYAGCREAMYHDPDDAEDAFLNAAVEAVLKALATPKPADPTSVAGERMREAFRAGWRTNAVGEDVQSASYLDGCEQVDFDEYQRLGFAGYLAALSDAPVKPADAFERAADDSEQAWNRYARAVLANSPDRDSDGNPKGEENR
ncbi:MAG TPA: hypothetical protein VF637_07700 [Sphingomicrobium sp.]|jgi:hypothetical protein